MKWPYEYKPHRIDHIHIPSCVFQVCPGYRCVLCGTVAKSRNSLHSHMSRQHRGISTKDLPVVPMPAPFDAELASRLLAKSGVKVRFIASPHAGLITILP